jgi:hypothetical protein
VNTVALRFVWRSVCAQVDMPQAGGTGLTIDAQREMVTDVDRYLAGRNASQRPDRPVKA